MIVIVIVIVIVAILAVLMVVVVVIGIFEPVRHTTVICGFLWRALGLLGDRTGGVQIAILVRWVAAILGIVVLLVIHFVREHVHGTRANGTANVAFIRR